MNRKRILSWLLIIVAPLLTIAQQTTQYPNDYLSPEFHAGRRAAFKEKYRQMVWVFSLRLKCV